MLFGITCTLYLETTINAMDPRITGLSAKRPTESKYVDLDFNDAMYAVVKAIKPLLEKKPFFENPSNNAVLEQLSLILHRIAQMKCFNPKKPLPFTSKFMRNTPALITEKDFSKINKKMLAKLIAGNVVGTTMYNLIKKSLKPMDDFLQPILEIPLDDFCDTINHFFIKLFECSQGEVMPLIKNTLFSGKIFLEGIIIFTCSIASFLIALLIEEIFGETDNSIKIGSVIAYTLLNDMLKPRLKERFFPDSKAA